MKILQVLGRVMTGAAFIVSGTLHFTSTAGFEQIVPPMLPAKKEIVYFTGVLEILGGIGLMIPPLQSAAGKCLALLLLLIYPANIYHAVGNVEIKGFPNTPIYHIIRLPMQFVLMWWVWRLGKPAKTKEVSK